MICVECGREAEGLVDGSCPACFAAKNPLLVVPEVIDIELCAHCDARRVGAHWAEAEEGAPIVWIREDAVREALQVHARVQDPEIDLEERPEDAKHFLYQVHMQGAIEGVPVSEDGTTRVRMRRGVCDRCSRLFGGFYAAIIQLRATDRDVSEQEIDEAHQVAAQSLERQRLAGNRFSFLAKDGPMHGGHDYFIGDIDAARNVARELRERLGASLQESAKLVGRREGEDVHRVTFLVRIRLFAPGDFAEAGERVVRVLGISRGHAIVTDLESHRRTRLPESDLRRVGGPEVVRPAVLVSSSPDGLQVLDPVDFRTQDLLRPADYEPEGEEVSVLRHEGRLYLVPVVAARSSPKS